MQVVLSEAYADYHLNSVHAWEPGDVLGPSKRLSPCTHTALDPLWSQHHDYNLSLFSCLHQEVLDVVQTVCWGGRRTSVIIDLVSFSLFFFFAVVRGGCSSAVAGLFHLLMALYWSAASQAVITLRSDSFCVYGGKKKNPWICESNIFRLLLTGNYSHGNSGLMFCTQASWNPLCSCKAGKNILTEAVWCLLDFILEQTGILEVTVHVLIQQMLSPTSVVKESIDMFPGVFGEFRFFFFAVCEAWPHSLAGRRGELVLFRLQRLD